jgi:hypothetical protein
MEKEKNQDLAFAENLHASTNEGDKALKKAISFFNKAEPDLEGFDRAFYAVGTFSKYEKADRETMETLPRLLSVRPCLRP